MTPWPCPLCTLSFESPYHVFFQNRCGFHCTYTPKKCLVLNQFNLTFFFCTGLISHHWSDFCLACSMAAQGVKSSIVCGSGHIDSIKIICDGQKWNPNNHETGPTWPQNHCAATRLFSDQMIFLIVSLNSSRIQWYWWEYNLNLLGLMILMRVQLDSYGWVYNWTILGSDSIDERATWLF